MLLLVLGGQIEQKLSTVKQVKRFDDFNHMSSFDTQLEKFKLFLIDLLHPSLSTGADGVRGQPLSKAQTSKSGFWLLTAQEQTEPFHGHPFAFAHFDISNAFLSNLLFLAARAIVFGV